MKKIKTLLLFFVFSATINAQDCSPIITSPRLGFLDFAPDSVVLCNEEKDSELLSISKDFDTYQWYRKYFTSDAFEPVPGATSSTLLATGLNDMLHHFKVVVTKGKCTAESNVVLIDGYAYAFPSIVAEFEEGSFKNTDAGVFNICDGSKVQLSNFFNLLYGKHTWYSDIPTAIPPVPEDPGIIPGETSSSITVTESGIYGFYACTEYCPTNCELLGTDAFISLNFGSWDFCTLGIDDSILDKDVIPYPNPTTNLLFLGGKDMGINLFKEINIIDMTGKKIKSLINHIVIDPINVSDISKGTYLIVAKDQNNKSYRSRFIKK